MEDDIIVILDANRLMAISTVMPNGWPQATLVGYANEGLLIYFLVRHGTLPGIYGRGAFGDPVLVPFWFFWIDFLFVWMSVWLMANGPMRVPFLHWRFFGGRLV